MLRRLLATFPHNFWQNDRQQSLLIVALSLITSLWLWLEGGRVLDVESLQALWYANHTPHNLFEQLLVPLARNPDLAVAVMAALSTFSLWLFCRLARLTGIGAQTTFILFLLLNFNPEYNDVRLQISRFQPVLILWLCGLYLFLAHYKNHIHLAFLGWAIPSWLAALFVPVSAFWAGGFPLLFLLWPGRGNWQQRLCERGRFLLAYYALIIIAIACVPQWRQTVSDWLPKMLQQIDMTRSEFSFLINADNPVELSIFEGILVSLVLIALNAVKIMGPLIAVLALLALRPQHSQQTVLEKRVRLLHSCSLVWLGSMAALAYLYYGSLPSDLFYTPFTMLTLWLASGVVFDALQRVKSERIPPERRLILIWLMVACALASIITFGPRATYLRQAGEWAQAQTPVGAIYSNNLTALGYSGRPPFLDGQAYIDMEHPRQEYFELTPDDLLIHIKNRKQPEPQDLDFFDILAEYHNERGDKAYILRVKP